MCLVLISVQMHPKYNLIIAGNRDEYYARPTEPLHFWKDHPTVLGGRDLQGGGSWLAASQNGKIACLTNYRDPAHWNTQAKSRGNLVTEFLTGAETPEDYVDRIRRTKNEYNGFNILLSEGSELHYYSSVSDEYKLLGPGIYGMSNHLLDTPWPKVTLGKQVFSELISSNKVDLTSEIFQLLQNRSIPLDELLPDTGVGLELERKLSPLFIHMEKYGTRSSAVVTVSKNREISFTEQSYTAIGELANTPVTQKVTQ